MSYSFKYILNEASWKKAYSAFSVIQQFPDKWVHFSDPFTTKDQRAPLQTKLGINPLSYNYHFDAPGIYLYPTNWIINGGSEYLEMEEMQGVTYKAFYIASLSPDANILALNDLTEAECEDIARRNGWLDAYTNMMNIKGKWLIYNETPAHCFYNMLTHLTHPERHRSDRLAGIVGDKPRSWFTLLKGYDGILDRNGIIYAGEDEQMVVFSKRHLKIEHFDHNKQVDMRLQDVTDAITDLEDSRILRTYWKNKALHVEFNAMGVKIKMSVDKRGMIRAQTDTFIHLPISDIEPERSDFKKALHDELENSLLHYKKIGY